MGVQSLYVLFEHASGYALFRVKEFEEVSVLLPQVESSVTDLSKFNGIVKLTSFSPFKTGTNALDNLNSISEGLLHDDLRTFLDANVPKGKKEKVILGIADSKIAGAINEELSIMCQHTGVVPEIIRGIRVHFHNFVKGLTEKTASKAQLGLGHSYSRSKVKFNVNRVDNMIIQSINLLDLLDKDVNTFSMRIREWYSYHFPELARIVTDNFTFARVAHHIKDRKELSQDSLEGLEEIVMDSAKAQAIIDAARSSMGMDISPIDLINIERFASRVVALTEYRHKLSQYLSKKMDSVSPNLTELVGEQVGARLIAHAGSLTNLAKYPASTVQILGAEKALFRALKTRGNTPKYGLIFNSAFISRAGLKNKGRISRYLANKCSICSRIDCFSDNPTKIYGSHMKKQVEDRLSFYETGLAPPKNLDVMRKAIVEAKASIKQKKKDKKLKKKLQKANGSLNTTQEIDTTQEMDTTQEDPDVSQTKKKKKKKEHKADESVNTTQEVDTTQEDAADTSRSKKKNKKKKKRDSANVTMDTTGDVDEAEPTPKKKKKKKD